MLFLEHGIGSGLLPMATANHFPQPWGLAGHSIGQGCDGGSDGYPQTRHCWGKCPPNKHFLTNVPGGKGIVVRLHRCFVVCILGPQSLHWREYLRSGGPWRWLLKVPGWGSIAQLLSAPLIASTPSAVIHYVLLLDGLAALWPLRGVLDVGKVVTFHEPFPKGKHGVILMVFTILGKDQLHGLWQVVCDRHREQPQAKHLPRQLPTTTKLKEIERDRKHKAKQ